MLVIWKNKGILVPVYVIVCFIGIAFLHGIIQAKIPFGISSGVFAGLALLLSGIWTYLTGEEYIKKDGKKIKVDIDNRFFFIPMKIVGIILLIIGSLTIIYGIFNTIRK